MNNHFHLFIRTPRSGLSAGMHDLNSGYVTVFNRRYSRSGPLFQGRFKAILVEREYHYWELSRYIHLNPVRAGLVKNPEEYGWSSCRAYLGLEKAPEWLAWEEVLEQHGQSLRSARQEYRRFLLEGISRPPISPFKEVVASTLLGSSNFVERVKNRLQDCLPERDVPAARELRREILLSAVTAAVCQAYGISADQLTVRGRKENEARSVAVYLCRRLSRASIREIGAFFGGVDGSAVSHIVAKVLEKGKGDKKLKRTLMRLEQALGQDSSFKT